MSDSNRQDRDAELLALIEKVPSEKAKDYIKVRLLPQRNWYAKKSREAKQQYHAWMLASIILSALIPVFTLIADTCIAVRLLITALSSGVAFINSYLLLKNAKGQWATYRSTGELLLRTLYLYLTSTGSFANCSTQDEQDKLLFQVCEDILAKESADWLTNMEQS